MPPIILKGGFTTTDPRLDRVPVYREESRAYSVRPVLGVVGATRRRVKSWRPGHRLVDQGREGACTWFGLANGLNASPVRRRPPIAEDVAFRNYRRAQNIDEWPETYEGGAEGCSVNAAMTIAREDGMIREWRWIGAGSQTPMEDIIDTLDLLGGIEFGWPWWESMFTPRPSGLLEVDRSSGLAGYHALWALAHRYAPIPGEGPKKVDHIVLAQSWGPSHGVRFYGVPGHVFVRLEDVAFHLMPREVYGEGAVPLEVAFGPS